MKKMSHLMLEMLRSTARRHQMVYSSWLYRSGNVQLWYVVARSIHWLLAASMLLLIFEHAIAQLPAEFGPGLKRIAATKSWLLFETYLPAYQWLPDGRLLIWVQISDHPQARLLDPKTGKQENPILFNRLFFINPPLYGNLFNHLSPDGNWVVSL